MELTAWQLIGVLFLTSLSIIIIRWWFFLPYQNRLMCWYMKRYSREYRLGKMLFEEMLTTQQECSVGKASKQEGYINFLLYLHGDKRFVLIEDIKQKFHEVMTLEEIMEYDGEPKSLIEKFTCCIGKGNKNHCVSVLFANESCTHLESIELVYQDKKREDSFLYLIEKKEFPKDGNGGRSSTPIPEPVLENC